MNLFGAILAGGNGVRIGGRKAMRPFADEPLVAHVARALEPANPLAVVGDAEAAAALGAPLLTDDPSFPDRGPLVGVCAALEWAHAGGAAWIVLAPCDTPLLPNGLAARLIEAAGEGGGACVRTASGLEPLIAVWRPSLAPPLRRALTAGHPPAHRFILAHGFETITLADDRMAMNVNSPEDLSAALALAQTLP